MTDQEIIEKTIAFVKSELQHVELEYNWWRIEVANVLISLIKISVNFG